jgi:hypothetical protein
MSINNLLNHTNPGPIIDNITSPLFGHANQASGGGGGFGGGGGLGFSESANNRWLELQMRFSLLAVKISGLENTGVKIRGNGPRSRFTGILPECARRLCDL